MNFGRVIFDPEGDVWMFALHRKASLPFFAKATKSSATALHFHRVFVSLVPGFDAFTLTVSARKSNKRAKIRREFRFILFFFTLKFRALFGRVRVIHLFEFHVKANTLFNVEEKKILKWNSSNGADDDKRIIFFCRSNQKSCLRSRGISVVFFWIEISTWFSFHFLVSSFHFEVKLRRILRCISSCVCARTVWTSRHFVCLAKEFRLFVWSLPLFDIITRNIWNWFYILRRVKVSCKIFIFVVLSNDILSHLFEWTAKNCSILTEYSQQSYTIWEL